MKIVYTISLIAIMSIITSAYAQSTDSLNKRGVERGKDGRHKSARSDFNRAVSIYNQESARLLHNQGLVLEKRGNVDEAIRAYKEAVRRNPLQSQSQERLGYWHYKQGNYAEAVKHGELTLELDPDNRLVKSWIYAAYKMKVDSIEANPDYSQHVTRKPLSNGESQYQQIAPFRSTFYGVCDFGLKFSYKPDADQPVNYEHTKGLLANIPYKLFAFYRPYQKFGFFGKIENPYTGAGLPQVVSQSERFETLYYKDRLVIGLGLLLNHYNAKTFEDKTLLHHDFKIGSTVHYEGEDYIMDLLFYPRLLLIDWSYLSGRSYDTAQFDFRYTYKFKPDFHYYVGTAGNDYYFINHDTPRSDYYGYTDFSIGGYIDNYTFTPGVDLRFTLQAAQRIYIVKSTDDPYTFFNGQSFLGFDSKRDNDSFFSGQKMKSTIFTLRIDERFSENFFIYQSLLLELVGLEGSQHELMIQFGAGYIR